MWQSNHAPCTVLPVCRCPLTLPGCVPGCQLPALPTGSCYSGCWLQPPAQRTRLRHGHGAWLHCSHEPRW